MPPHDRRLSTRKIVALIAIALFLGTGSLALWIRHAVSRKWTALEQRMEAELTRINSRDSLRPPLRGPVLPGNAWDDYLPALTQPPKWTNAEMGLLQLFLQGKDVADRELVAKIVVRDGAYVDTVLKGARRERSRYAYSDELHRQWQIPEGLQGASNSLQLLAVCQGKLLSQGGKPREAMELLLDLGLFGRDLSDRAFYIDESDGLGVMGTAFRELQGMVVSGALGQELLTDLEKQLKRLDDLWPDHRTALIGDLLNLGTLLLREDRSDDELYTINNTPRNRREWRYLFSSRFKATRCFNVAEDWIEQAIQAEKQPWEATNRTIQRLFQESRQSKDPLLRELYGILTSMSVREVRATCRLLQMAAHYRATGEILALEDPYGGQLRSSVSGGRLRAWSIGPFPEEYNPAQAKPTGYVRSLELEVDR